MRDFIPTQSESPLTKSLEEITREGARKMLKNALEAEIDDFFERPPLDKLARK